MATGDAPPPGRRLWDVNSLGRDGGASGSCPAVRFAEQAAEHP
jgi:hypothetical protein